MSKAGKHMARATGPQDVQFGMSSNENLQIAVTFRFANPDDEYFGQTIIWTGTFAPGKASEIALEVLETCGWTGEDVMDMTGIDANEVELVIFEEPNEDGTRVFDKVKFVNRSGASRFKFQKPVEGNDLRGMSRILGQNIRAIRASQGRKPAPRPAAPAPRPVPPARPQSRQAPAETPEQIAATGDNEFPF